MLVSAILPGWFKMYRWMMTTDDHDDDYLRHRLAQGLLSIYPTKTPVRSCIITLLLDNHTHHYHTIAMIVIIN
ncbi:hypothetical protein VTJ04DRAFT_2952 [Mycothermus thermophilus]|uniref:uncharacterized protein n=1 Tax=Humicola insolens TaxID=85995 RepID=UPI003743D5EB